MPVEYEATFIKINKDEMRAKLQALGAQLIKPEFLQKRMVFSLPSGHEINGGWLRVRDEQDKITMSLKVVDGDKIENQKEICVKINDFQAATELLQAIGCSAKAYQENKRELWRLENTEITIDEWPFLEPLIEIESPTEGEVKDVSRRLGFDYATAKFCSTDVLYSEKYNLPKEVINNETKEILFDMKNPFLK